MPASRPARWRLPGALALTLAVSAATVLPASADTASAARAASDRAGASAGLEASRGGAAATSSAPRSTATSSPSATSSASPSSSSSSSSGSSSRSSASPSSSSASSTAAASVAGAGDLSGLDWNSGVFISGGTKAKIAAFGDWRGSEVDVIVDWPARATWSDIVNPSWLYSKWKGTPQTKVFGVAMVPEKDSSATIATCATGAHDARWREFGKNIQASGLADETIIRLGWEFNGDWYKWAAKDPATWVKCWRTIVDAAEETAPDLRWDWSVNRGPSQALSDPRKAYPGDDYVDVVGIDSYDIWPGVTSESAWKTHYAGKGGLKFWADFAEEHGKPVSVPEWGVYPGTAQAGHNGGDNPLYIAKMHGFFEEVGDDLAYEAYFNVSASYFAGSLHAPTQNPKAAAEYQELW